jgi:hypothetical protein
MATTEARAAMEVPTETAAGHATDHGRQIDGGIGVEKETEVIATVETTPGSTLREGTLISTLGVPMMVGLAQRQRGPMVLCPRRKSQLSLPKTNPSQRQTRRPNGFGGSKP